ncbi:MAG: hypothetical protein LBG83_08945, partial [Oscillospiraceae bacterium]|nr:hypothetical protein [Oscillospiraceae bacterium]
LELAAIGPGSYTVTAKAYVSGVLYAETTADATLAIALYDLTVNDESYKIDDDPATLEATSAYGVFDEVTFSIDGYGDVSASSGNTADLDLAAIGPGSYTVTAKAYVSGVLYAETTADATLAIALYDLTVADESFMIDDATATLEATSAYGVFDEVLFSIDGYGDVSASGGNIADLDLAAIGPGSFAVTAKAYVGGVLYAETTADATLAIALYDLDVADASFAVDETAAQLDVTLTGYAGATPIVEYFLEGDNGTFGPFTSDGQTTDVTVDLTAEGIPAGSYQLSVKAYVGTLLIAETAAGAEADFSVEAYDLGVGLDASEYFTDGSANISILSNYAGPMKLVISVDDQEVLTEDNVSDGDDIPLAIAGIGAGQHSLTAKAYDGNDVLLAEFIDGAQFDVKQYGMTVSSDKTDYKAGEPVVLTAQLDADYLTNNPAGGALVDFYLNEVLVGTQAADVNGEAILTLNSLAVAGYTLSAKAESDPREAILADTAGTAFVVSLYGMTLSTDATEYYADDTATLTATIAGYTPSASAEIKFYDETGALLASQSLAAATASADWANLVMGSHSATAIVFDPASGEADGRIAASTPAAFAVKYYALSLATSHPGYFTDDATGEVTATLVKDDGAAFAGSGSAQFGTLGNAAFAGDTAALGINPSALGAGTHTIEVTPKNGSVQLAQAETISFRVDTAPTLTLTKDKTTYYAGEKAVITATIANNTGAGKVVFYVGNAAPKEVALTDGKATLKLDYLQEGSLTIKASVLLEAPYEKAFSAPDLTFSIGPMILQPFWPTLDDMPTSVSIKRRFYKGNDYFTKFDSDDVKWTVSNSKKFTIDPDTGFITFKRFGGIGRVDVTATDLNGKPIKTCTVTLKWMWYEWICVVLFFGWIYL